MELNVYFHYSIEFLHSNLFVYTCHHNIDYSHFHNLYKDK